MLAQCGCTFIPPTQNTIVQIAGDHCSTQLAPWVECLAIQCPHISQYHFLLTHYLKYKVILLRSAHWFHPDFRIWVNGWGIVIWQTISDKYLSLYQHWCAFMKHITFSNSAEDSSECFCSIVPTSCHFATSLGIVRVVFGLTSRSSVHGAEVISKGNLFLQVFWKVCIPLWLWRCRFRFGTYVHRMPSTSALIKQSLWRTSNTSYQQINYFSIYFPYNLFERIYTRQKTNTLLSESFSL